VAVALRGHVRGMSMPSIVANRKRRARQMQRRDRVAVLWLAGLLVLCRAPAFADGPPRPEPVWVPEPVPESVRADEAPDAEEKWDFVVAPYIWLPAMTGDATVKGFDLSIDTDIEDIFAKTDFAFSISGVFETWYRRRWGMQLNAYWAILQQNRNLGGTPAEFDVTANMGLFELVGLYDIGERRFGSGSSGPTWTGGRGAPRAPPPPPPGPGSPCSGTSWTSSRSPYRGKTRRPGSIRFSAPAQSSASGARTGGAGDFVVTLVALVRDPALPGT
jgi:hypothetical protein